LYLGLINFPTAEAV